MSDTRLLSAVIFGQQKHAGQVRKYGDGEPYFNHCLRVAKTVSDAGYLQDAVIAALLHDTLEDTQCTAAELQHLFGVKVRVLVEALTDIAPCASLNRAQRKAQSADKVIRGGIIAQAIKCADIVDNLPSIAKHDPDFCKVVLTETHYLLSRMNKSFPLFDKARSAYHTAAKLIYPTVQTDG